MEYILASTSEINAPATIKSILRSGLSADLQHVALSAPSIPPESCTAIFAGQCVVAGDDVVAAAAGCEARRRRDVLAEHANHPTPVEGDQARRAA
jgi:hypothetical protein